ncbi:hypothetical protein B9T26_07715 [Acinetobacter sp. ANC 4169]|uniref:hypothetical protein n=1 Tax=Acinetobacter sp. ANC 4169 TaxID=1977879 RepID=UPI000A344479|nr:hypothetical protein [Acinetobacter sp. ANC 4169]OTG74015.1 hypothetical protein B9T26_07715 [Acinetobacter sp. ANC 4169]
MIRTISFIIALIITLALTLATWLIPDPVEEIVLDIDTHKQNIESTPPLAMSLSADQILLEEFNQPQQFIVIPVIKADEKKDIVVTKEKKLQPSTSLPQHIEPAPPSPPNLIYTGQMIDAGGVKKVFLTFEDQTLVLSQGDIVSQRWKIESIQENQITIFDQFSNQLFVLNI